jgi:hypothetical protein
MITVTIPATEYFVHETNSFMYVHEQTLQLEHSLVSLSKWESKWLKPFISKEPKTNEESLDYIRCMTLTQNVDPNVYKSIPKSIMDQVSAYIEAPMTATVFYIENKGQVNKEIITSEVLYYWMIAANIPMDCQKWHLNRLIALVKVCGIKNSPQKKMSQRELIARNRDLNAARKKALNTKG